MSYVPPRWAQTPDVAYEWSLMEIKGGVPVGHHPLQTKACTVLGRAADQVDIPLQHESISRQHARIAFDSGGFPWLRDLGSTHGTTCNKKTLPPVAVGKMERDDHTKGSRGVMIFPGDILQFGASTRLFCVEGPPEFERGAFQARQKQLEQKRLVDREKAQVLRIDEEGDADAAEEPPKKQIPMDAEVPQKYQKTLERLNAAKYKLQNLQTEDERIRRKGELSEGQEKQLQRNAEREKALMENIEVLETELFDKLYPEQAGKESFAQRSQQVVEQEDDEFFDRTKRVDKSVVEDGESETTLTEKWKRLQTHLHERQLASLESARDKVDRLSALHSDLETRGDTEEAFFLQNDLQLAKEDLQKISKSINETESNLAEIEKFLRVVNPKLRFDRISGYIGVADPSQPANEKSPSEQSMDPPSPNEHSFAMLPPPSQSLVAQPGQPFAMLPPPPKRVALTNTTTDESSPEHVLPDPMMPPPKRIRVVGPVMPPSRSAASALDGNRPSRPAKDHQRAKVQNTLDFISSMYTTKKIVNSTPSLPKEATTSTATVLTLDPKADTWRAPTGQDGSGKTKLNAKFADRY